MSIISLHWQAAAAVGGGLIGIWLGGPFRAVWFGITLSLLLHIVGTRLYGGTLDWYYFLACIPPLCLLLAPVASAIRPRALAAVALTLWALGVAAQATFIYEFDTRAIARGLLTVDESRLGVRLGRAIAHSVPLRELRTIGEGLGRFVPDGATALAAAHGARGELWREAGAEFLPAAAAPDPASPWQFIMMGPGVELVAGEGRVLAGRVCASTAPELEWRLQHPPLVPGWETPGFDDSTWRAVPVPRREARSSPGGFAPVSSWRVPQLMARGRMMIHTRRSPQLIGVTVRAHECQAGRYRLSSMAAWFRQRIGHLIVRLALLTNGCSTRRLLSPQGRTRLRCSSMASRTSSIWTCSTFRALTPSGTDFSNHPRTD